MKLKFLLPLIFVLLISVSGCKSLLMRLADFSSLIYTEQEARAFAIENLKVDAAHTIIPTKGEMQIIVDETHLTFPKTYIINPEGELYKIANCFETMEELTSDILKDSIELFFNSEVDSEHNPFNDFIKTKGGVDAGNGKYKFIYLYSLAIHNDLVKQSLRDTSLLPYNDYMYSKFQKCVKLQEDAQLDKIDFVAVSADFLEEQAWKKKEIIKVLK